MRVADLKRLLEDCDPDAEVRFASQPSWPFEYSVASVEEIWPEPEYDDCDLDEDGQPLSEPDYCEEDDVPTVYLVEGSQLGYLPGSVKNQIGW